MKKIFYLLSIIILSACSNEEKKLAEIKLNLDNIEFIEVNNPIDEINIWDMKIDTIYPNKNNEFFFQKRDRNTRIYNN